MMTLEEVKGDEKVIHLMEKANQYLGVIGYTEHGWRHAGVVSGTGRKILEKLKRPVEDQELVAIAGFLHDIGNVVNREYHAPVGAMLAYDILSELGMTIGPLTEVIGAIGNHHEEDGDPISPIAAALIIADKSDVHRSRVRNPRMIKFDIHDRVNYAVEESRIRVISNQKIISMELKVDTEISTVMEYFEIFMDRMLISKRAANFLNAKFQLLINGTKMV